MRLEAMQKNFLKLFLLPLGGESWTGGITYTKNLIYALNKYRQDVKVFMFDGENNGLFSNFDNVSFVKKYDKNSVSKDLINKIARHFFSYDFKTSTLLRKDSENSPDVVFPTRLKLGKDIATLYWIPDFQILHLPEMYRSGEVRGIRDGFISGINNSTLVVLSSNDAKKDLEQFMPDKVGKARVVRFAAHIPDNLYDTNPIEVTKKYNLPEKFFYLPNQFWKHKNHILVFKAMKILKEKGVFPFIVLTGNPVDSRNPLYYAEMAKLISQWGLRDQIAILGLVDHYDVYMLIRQAICVINPSLFEGWSTSVEEAKSVGKRLLLSDLEVHREQSPLIAKYFAPNDAEKLSELMREEWESVECGPDYSLEENARKDLPSRMRIFADSFVSAAKEAVKIKRQ